MINPLPKDDPWRTALHNEVHARPSARVRLPALIVYIAVTNAETSREQEYLHLQKLPNQNTLELSQLQGNFLRLQCERFTVKWERHTEFTRYSIVQALPEAATLDKGYPNLLESLLVSQDWLKEIPGKTIAAIQLALVHGDLSDPLPLMELSKLWFGAPDLVASQLGSSAVQSQGHSWALTDFQLRADGFERILVVAQPDTTETRAGRISQRLLELETYRLMALRGLPVAKQLGPKLTLWEEDLANLTTRLESKIVPDQELLDTLVSLSGRVEQDIAQHSYRFSATNAYNMLVQRRIRELREKPIPGTQTIGEFLQRRLSPAMATVAATEHRLSSLSERIARTSALLRTRVEIATENQNQLLLAKLTRGQELQLRLQGTVEGLSIAAISYYVISLLLYSAKALKAAGAPLNPEIATGALIPVVLWLVWMTIRRIHATLHHVS